MTLLLVEVVGIANEEVEALLSKGEYEKIIENIEKIRSRDVFTQEIRDVFSRSGELSSVVMLIAELFNDVLITTNYDQLIEQSFQIGSDVKIQ